MPANKGLLLLKLKHIIKLIRIVLTTDVFILLNSIEYKRHKPSAMLKYSPLGITFWISDKCNLNCSFCLRNKDNSGLANKHDILEDMSLKTFKRILKIFPGAEYVGIIGQGEPLLNKEALEMFEWAVSRNRKVRLVTNGVLINEKLAKDLIDLGLHEITVSLKAISSEEYERISGRSGRDAFNKVCDALRFLVKYKKVLRQNTILVINFTLFKSILHHMPDVVNIAETLGVDKLRFNNYIPFGDGNGIDAGEVLFDTDIEAVDAVGKIKSHASPVEIILPKLIRSKDFTGNCSSCFRVLSIDAKGDVSFCDRVLPPSGKMGNVFIDKEVWNCGYIVKFRERLLSGRGNLPERCRLCVEMSTAWPG